VQEIPTAETKDVVRRRLDMLMADLAEALARNTRRARANYLASIFFVWGALLASCLAAVAGVFELMSSKLVGSLALIPGIVSVFPTQLKFQERAHWHFRKKDLLQGIMNEARFGLPDPPSLGDIKHLAEKFTTLNLQMGAEWMRDIGSNDEASALEGNLPSAEKVSPDRKVETMGKPAQKEGTSAP
jgi:hypothetical protein